MPRYLLKTAMLPFMTGLQSANAGQMKAWPMADVGSSPLVAENNLTAGKGNDMNNNTVAAPTAPGSFIQGNSDVLKEDLVIDGKTMSVLEVAQGYRMARTLFKVSLVLGVVATIGFAGSTYWFTTHPVEKVLMIAPISH